MILDGIRLCISEALSKLAACLWRAVDASPTHAFEIQAKRRVRVTERVVWLISGCKIGLNFLLMEYEITLIAVRQSILLHSTLYIGLQGAEQQVPSSCKGGDSIRVNVLKTMG